jgi:hypothetical protein
MEAPAIIIGVMLMRRYDKSVAQKGGLAHIIKESFTNGSVLMIWEVWLSELLQIANKRKAFARLQQIFLKDFWPFFIGNGYACSKRFKAFKELWLVCKLLCLDNSTPLIVCISILVTHFFHIEPGNRFLLAILASVLPILLPAAMRLAAPKADIGLYIPMALGVTFPFNITIHPALLGLIQYL